MLLSCAMIIMEPNALVSGEAGVGMLKPAPEDLLIRWPVSKRVNRSKAPVDDPTLIERI